MKDQELEQLEKELELWEQTEPKRISSRRDWRFEGERIYRSLLQRNPQNSLHKIGLANILINIGYDKKFQDESYSEARAIFNSILDIDPVHGLAHYHLGYIDFDTNDYEEAIRHFNICLNSNVPPIYKLKTYAYLSKCYHNSGQEEQADMYQEACRNLTGEMTSANDLSEGRNFYQDLKKYRQDIPIPKWSIQVRIGKRILPKKAVSDRQLQDVWDFDDPFLLVLDDTKDRPELIGSEDIKFLRDNHVVIFERLVKDTNPVSKENLIRNLTEINMEAGEYLKKGINELRKALAACLGIDMELTFDLIKTVRGFGYQWNWEGEIKIYRKI